MKLLPWCGMVFLGMYIRLGYDVLRGSGETVNLNISTYLKPSTFIIIMAQMLLLYGLLLLLRERNQAFCACFHGSAPIRSGVILRMRW